MDIYFDEGTRQDYDASVAGYEDHYDELDEDAYCEDHDALVESCYDEHVDD